jgi:RNase E specificity factor CsrD
MTIHLVYLDPMAELFPFTAHHRAALHRHRFYGADYLFSVRWIRRQLAGQELLELRTARILNGERGPQVRGSVHEWPANTSSALDMLLSELQFASDQRSRMDTLIRSYARRIQNRAE